MRPVYLRRPIKAYNSWLMGQMSGRGQQIAGVTLHSTRSGEHYPDEGERTEKWYNNPLNASPSPSNPQYGTYADWLIFKDGTQVICTDSRNQYARWAAGYGRSGSWAMGHVYEQIEIAQGTEDEPFTDAAIDSTAQLCAERARLFNWPLTHIPYVNQTEQPPPRGITTHDGCMNGTIYVKSDTGKMFPWDRFLALARQYYQEDGNPMTELVYTMMPVDMTRCWISGNFGQVAGYGHAHRGVDIAGSFGTPIYCPADGVAVPVYNPDGSFGNAVSLDHLNTPWYSLYAHMAYAPLVSPGQRVVTGQLMGYIGSTGLSSGPHLHWQQCTSKNYPPDISQSTDPLKYVQLEDDMTPAEVQSMIDAALVPYRQQIVRLETDQAQISAELDALNQAEVQRWDIIETASGPVGNMRESWNRLHAGGNLEPGDTGGPRHATTMTAAGMPETTEEELIGLTPALTEEEPQSEATTITRQRGKRAEPREPMYGEE